VSESMNECFEQLIESVCSIHFVSRKYMHIYIWFTLGSNFLSKISNSFHVICHIMNSKHCDGTTLAAVDAASS